MYQAVIDWISAHPKLMSSPIVWGLLTATVTAIFRHRTPEELDQLPKAFAFILGIMSSAGLDSRAILSWFRPASDAPNVAASKPPSVPPAAVMCLAAMALTSSACFTGTDRQALAACEKQAATICLQQDAGINDPICLGIEDIQPFVQMILARRIAGQLLIKDGGTQ